MARNRIRVVRSGGSGGGTASAGTATKGVKFRVVKRKPGKLAVDSRVQTTDATDQTYSMRDVTPGDVRGLRSPILERTADVAGRPARQDYGMDDASVRPAQPRTRSAETGVRPVAPGETPVRPLRSGIKTIKPAKFDWT